MQRATSRPPSPAPSRWRRVRAAALACCLAALLAATWAAAAVASAGPIHIDVAPQADLAITKTDGVTTAVAGGSVVYTITVSNAGPSGVTGATVADTFPWVLTATWSCVGAGGGTCSTYGWTSINDTVNLPAGGSVTYIVVANLLTTASGTLSNTATVAAPGGVTDPTPGNNSATDTDTIVQQADLAITKTDGVTTAAAGGSVTYTITASNAGPSSVTGVTVADTFPASLTVTWTCGGAGGGTCTASGSGNINDTVNLPYGGSVTYIASATVSDSASGTLSNTATVAAPGGVTDPTPGNNSATDSDTIVRQADLAITKTDGVTTAIAGGSVTYTITASNAGPSSVTGATVADTFPASLTATWTCAGAGGGTCTASGSGNINDTVNLPAGGSVTYTASATVSAAATGTLANTATVAAPGGVTDPTPANDSATDSDTIVRQADLAITKTDGITTAIAGGSVTYTITASNAGPSNVTGATVADTFPASLTATWTCVGAGGGTCTASGSGNINDTVNLPAGGSVTYTASATVSAAATGTLANTATVAAPGGVTDPTPANDSATDSDTLVPAVAVTIEQAAGQADPAGASPVLFTAVFAAPVTGFDAGDVTIGGTAGATTASVTEAAPNDGTTYRVSVSGMASSGTVTASIPAGAATGSQGQPSAASTSADSSVTFAPATPVVTGIVRAGADPTSAAAVQFTVTFSRDVTGVGADDFGLAASGVVGAAITGVAGSGATYTVSVSTGSGSGTVGLNLVDDDSIVDGLGGKLGGAGPGNGSFTGAVYAVDRAAPTAGGLVAPAPQQGAATYQLTVVYADNLAVDVSTLGAGDVLVTGPGGFSQLATLVGVSPAGDGSPRTATYQITAPGGAWDAADIGAYAVALQAGQVADTAGNAAAAAQLGGFSLSYGASLPLVVRPAPPAAPSAAGARRSGW